MKTDANFLKQLRAEHEIQKVLLTYARGSDRADFDLMRSAYHEDATDNHGPFNGPVKEYLEWAKQHHERYDVLMHMMGPANIEFESDEVAFTESYCFLIQRMVPEQTYNSEVSLHITIACRYLDRFEKRAGAWKIAERNVVYEWVKKEWTSENVAPDNFPESFMRGLRSREDQVYKQRRDR